MNKEESFENFLASGVVEFSVWNYSINILLTALLAYLLGILYTKYGNSLSNRNSFRKNFVILAVTTMIIITIVKSSLALSLGLVGALSIVRFRAAIKEPEELTYLFLNIAIGLGLGANQKIPTIIGFLFVVIYLISRNVFFKKISSDENQNLLITLTVNQPTKDQLDEMVEILKVHCLKVNLKRFDEDNEILESSFLIEVGDFAQIAKAKNNLQEKFSNLKISFIDNNLNI